MKSTLFTDKFVINKGVPYPLYQQLVEGVLDAIKEKVLSRGDKIPSINELSAYYQVSRATIERGFTDLREMGVLESIRGKGYFIANNQKFQGTKILLLFNSFNTYNKIILDSFVETIGNKANIDCYIYENNSKLLSHLLEKRVNDYTHYVIMPNCTGDVFNTFGLIDNSLKSKIILIGTLIKELSEDFGAVYENSKSDIYYALVQAEEPLQKYNTIKLVFPENDLFPREIIEGFECFCKKFQFDYKIVKDITIENINPGDAYITILDEDLTYLLDRIINLKYQLGKDIGVISYNESNEKKLILNGVTTISTDFKLMGITAAHLVLNGSKSIIANPFRLTLRASV